MDDAHPMSGIHPIPARGARTVPLQAMRSSQIAKRASTAVVVVRHATLVGISGPLQAGPHRCPGTAP